jgi:c-di-GMP-binding flagellar brake protein YcgR
MTELPADRARLLDVSPTGARFREDQALAVDSVHDFSFDLLGETVRVRARVRHCQPEETGSGYQVGVQFLDVEDASARRITEYARRRRGRA